MHILDALLGFFWATTYLGIIINQLKYKDEKKVFMPLIAGGLNFAWELNAVIFFNGNIVNEIWLILDLFIIFYNIKMLISNRQRYIYCLLCLGFIVLIYVISTSAISNGMMISAFIIDIIMAVEYVLVIKKISQRNRLFIGILRTLGDLFACLLCMNFSYVIMTIGIFVVFINLFYISYCLELKQTE